LALGKSFFTPAGREWYTMPVKTSHLSAIKALSLYEKILFTSSLLMNYFCKSSKLFLLNIYGHQKRRFNYINIYSSLYFNHQKEITQLNYNFFINIIEIELLLLQKCFNCWAISDFCEQNLLFAINVNYSAIDCCQTFF
jgi:hypothetical protein